MRTAKAEKITAALIRDLDRQAADSPRQRANHNFHPGPEDPVQRLIVVMRKNTYIRPHRHAAERKWEFAVALAGRMQVLLLNDDASLGERIELAPGGRVSGLEIPPEAWHTWLALDDGAAFFECKPGPYSAAKTNVFAPWSPPEGDPRVAAYLQWLARAEIGARPACF